MFSHRFGRRAALCFGGASLVVACAAPAAAGRGAPAWGTSLPGGVPPGPVRATRALVTDADRAMGLEWRFDAGGTIHAPPAVGVDGSVYLGTADGYVVSLDTRGRVQWSFTLEGAIAWSPVVDQSGRIYVATTAQRLCSFQSNGALGWQARTPAHVGTELVLASPSGVLFGGTDGNVWAYAEYGNPLWHAGVGPRITAGPRMFGKRAVVASVDGTVLELEGAMRRRALRIEAPCDSIVTATSDGSMTVVAGGALLGVGPRGEVRFRRAGVIWAESLDDGFVAVEGDGVLTRLAGDGTLVSSARIATEATAPPVVAPSGAIYVASASGALVIVGKGGAVRQIPIATAALHRPVLDLARRRVLVTAGSGIVASVRLEE